SAGNCIARRTAVRLAKPDIRAGRKTAERKHTRNAGPRGILMRHSHPNRSVIAMFAACVSVRDTIWPVAHFGNRNGVGSAVGDFGHADATIGAKHSGACIRKVRGPEVTNRRLIVKSAEY